MVRLSLDEPAPTPPARARRRPAVAAAIVNAALVFGLPAAYIAAVWRAVPADGRPPGYSSTPEVLISIVTFPFLTFPLIAAWRTYVHATRYELKESGGWQGVVEAGGLGFAVCLWGLRRGIVTRPAEAPPYIIVYGGFAIIVGLVVGLVLRTTAVVVLRLARGAPRS